MEYLRQEFEEYKQGCTGETSQRLLMRSLPKAIMWDKTGGRCWYCGEMMNPFREFSIDHVIPLSKGGNDSFNNLVPCCRRCNVRKSSRSLDEFRRLLSQYLNDIPRFTVEQLSYLEGHGFPVEIPQIKFYFEKK